MICRADHRSILLFEPMTGHTAIVSGSELVFLRQWLELQYAHPFVVRLKRDGWLTNFDETVRLDMLEQIDISASVTTPLRSFAVPESIHIDLTNACNMRCPQCYKGIGTHHELPFDSLQSIIAQAKSLRVFQIALGGGEPLLYPKISDAVRLISSTGMACSITTNGTLLSDDVLRELIKAGVHHIQVSLNGSTPAIHEQSRCDFDGAITAIRRLANSSVSFGINWVARRDNLYDIDQMIALCKHHSVGNLNVLRYKPSLTERYQDHALTGEEFIYLREHLHTAHGVAIKIDSAFSSLLCSIQGKAASPAYSGCGAGRRFFAIDCTGRFKGCSHMKESESPRDIYGFWYDSSMLGRLRSVEDAVSAPCGDCRSLASCRGCRVICEHLYGNFNNGEAVCTTYKGW